jgi:hypothetical protein
MNELKELSVFNRITFFEKTHTYYIDNNPTGSLSVTGFLKKFKKEFDQKSAARHVAKKTNTTIEQVLADWKVNNLYSTTIGSMLHKYIENFYCNKRVEFEGSFDGLGIEEKLKIVDQFPKLVGLFQNFYNDHKHLLCFKNEMIVGDLDDTNICGMLDLLAYNKVTDKLEILDFKTNKKMEKKSAYGNMLLYPFNEISEGELNEYLIQLNIYKYLIEKYTNLVIDKLKIVWFNVKNDNYKLYELESIQDKIKEMFDITKRSSLHIK